MAELQKNTDKDNILAFIDKGFSDSKVFCTQFLYSSEFTLNTLKGLVEGGKNRSKYHLSASLAEALQVQIISPDDILLAFVQQPRKWLSVKLGNSMRHPIFKPASNLLVEFGDEGWYGPIEGKNDIRKWYIRTFKLPYYQNTFQAGNISPDINLGTASPVATYQIRWTVVAEFGDKYVALSWNGFRYNDLKPGLVDLQIESLMQFPYWDHIPAFFDELMIQSQGNWQHPNLNNLILQNLWDKYIVNEKYIWRHLRIRTDNRGVALNAHSTGAFDQEEREMRGLQALSRHLAQTALNALNLEETSKLVNTLENALLRTLIHDWGLKSYEFSLDKKSDENGKQKGIIRSHCYFSNGKLKHQDSFQHLSCFVENYGGSVQALKFILSELQA
ncbi:MAG: hypothetical protein RMZ69_16630 [Nostoc sp. ChiQUE01a]|nr:hypothetical protein [Nostoc sp. ChiQUE01a]